MAGELKHGPLALVDDSMPVIMIVMRDPVYVVSLIKQLFSDLRSRMFVHYCYITGRIQQRYIHTS